MKSHTQRSGYFWKFPNDFAPFTGRSFGSLRNKTVFKGFWTIGYNVVNHPPLITGTELFL